MIVAEIFRGKMASGNNKAYFSNARKQHDNRRADGGLGRQ